MAVRRIAYGGLGVVLTAGLATLSWLVIDVTLVIVLFALAWEARALRIRLGRQHHVQVALATELYAHNVLLDRQFPVALTPLVLPDLVARGDVLDAYLLAVRGDLARIAPPVLRRLRDGLRCRGYDDWALTIAGQLTGTEADRRAATLLRGGIAVTSGAFRPTIEPATLDVVEDRVLLLAGPHPVFIADLDLHVVSRTEPIDIPLDVWLERHVTTVAARVRALRPAVLHVASDHLDALTAEAIGAAYGIPVVQEARGFAEETYLARQVHRYGWNLETHTEAYGLPDHYLRRRDLEDRIRRSAARVVVPSSVTAERIAAAGVPADRITIAPPACPPVTLDSVPGVTVAGPLTEGDTMSAAYAQVKARMDGPVDVVLGHSLPPYEAFAAGRAVVLPDEPELAGGNGAAELFTAGDPDALAAVLLALLADPDRRRRLAGKGAEWVRAERTRILRTLYAELRTVALPHQAGAADPYGSAQGTGRWTFLR